jgi:hypothetical protein
MKHFKPFNLAAAAMAAALSLVPPAPAWAQQVSFTIDGQLLNAGQGYTQGAPISLTWVLDDAAARRARIFEPGMGCCSGYIAWYQDLLSTSPQLWSSISGTGLSGSWQPPTDQDSGSLGLQLGDFPQPYAARFDLLANTQLGYPSGLQVNGFGVWGIQVQAVFIGLDAVGRYGAGTLFGVPQAALPDPTAMFLGLAGTYAVDPRFSQTGSIRGAAPTGPSQALFRVDQLTISAVPEPGTWALLLAGGVGVVSLAQRRQRVKASSGN